MTQGKRRTGRRVGAAILGALALGVVGASPAPGETPAALRVALELPFVHNEGQWDAAVAYRAQAAGAAVFVTKEGALVYSVTTPEPRRKIPVGAEPPAAAPASRASATASVVERPVGGEFRPSAGETAPTRVSFFLGNDPARWRPGIATSRSLVLGEVWPGIEVSLRTEGGRLEKLFTLLPGADPARIRVRVDGGKGMAVDADGSLAISTVLGELRFTPPVAYQERNGARETVSAAYVVRGNEYGFRLGRRDPTLPVVIDPFLQSTFVGGGSTKDNFDQVTEIRIDPASGDVFAGGITNPAALSAPFPGVTNGAQPSYGGGNQDVFVARFNGDLTVLKQATYLGGSLYDEIGSLAIHPTTGDIYVCGVTASTNFPGMSMTSAQQALVGGSDAFVTKLAADLKTAPVSTYLGDAVTDYATDIAIHPTTGNVYVAGFTDSAGLPFTGGGYQPSRANVGSFEAWIAKLNPNLSKTPAPQATFLGGTSFEQIFAIAISASAGVYVTGITNSTDFPGRQTGAQTTTGGGFADVSAFVSLLNANLTALTRSTYFGADGQDTVFGIAINSASGDVYITGGTASLSLPKTLTGAQRVRQGPTDNYVARFNGTLTQLLGATYYGGTGAEGANAVDVDSSTGDVYVAGVTTSSKMPGTTAGAQRIYGDGGLDAFAVRFNAALTTVLGATFLGGAPDPGTPGKPNNSGYDEALAIRFDAARGEVYLAGYTASSDTSFPKTAGGAQALRGGTLNDGGVDGFLTRVTPDLHALFAPQELIVDPAPGGAADGNGVFEPGETAAVQPAWKNQTSLAASLTGGASSFTGPAGASYTIPDAAASYGSVAAGATKSCTTVPNCFSLSVSAPATRPAGHWDTTFIEKPTLGGTTDDAPMKWTLHIGDSFTDVPRSYPFYRKIETLFHNGVTVGCTATTYCLGDKVPRASMAIFIGRAIAGGAGFLPDRGVIGATPYACTFSSGVSLFPDVAPTDIACPAIHYLVALNVATGCPGGLFCSAPNVTRGEMAIFMARGVVAPGGGAAVPQTYGPDPVTGRSYSCSAGSPNLHFTDIAPADLFCKHVHFLWAKGMIDGCGGTLYCPVAQITRAEMAKFLSNAFLLPLYAPNRMTGPDSGGAVARYWDENREKAKDPAYWMAHPLCRQAINRRVSGNPHEWPLDWFKRVHAATPFERGVSWGCGLGAFERAAIKAGIVRRAEAFDISPKSLEDARKEAENEGLHGIEYRRGDFDDPELPPGRYDVAFFHASLHHVRRLERLFRRLRRGLPPSGAVYVDEYVGPSRTEWTRERLAAAQAVLDGLPADGKLRSRIELPIEPNDPSEAIRSGEIASFLRQHLDLVEWRPYGGQIASLVFPNLSREWTESPEGLPWVSRMLEQEDEDLRRQPDATYYLVAYGRLRRRPASVSLAERRRRLTGRWRARFPAAPAA